MKLSEVKKLPLGLYVVHWKSGGTSLAAIGMKRDGDRWLAPVNWVFPTGEQHIWRTIEKLEHIEVPNATHL